MSIAPKEKQNQFEAKKDKQKLFERPQTRDLGYATNGKDRIEIKPLYLSKRETSYP